MSTIAAGIYFLKNNVTLPTTNIVLSDIRNYIKIAPNEDYFVQFRGTLTVTNTNIEVYSSVFQTTTLLLNSSKQWDKNGYNHWQITQDLYPNDDFYNWFTSNLSNGEDEDEYYEVVATSPEGVLLHTKDRLLDKDTLVTFPDSGGSATVEYMTVKVSYNWDINYGTGSAVVLNNGEGGELLATLLNDYEVKTLTITLPYTGKLNMSFTPDDLAVDHGSIYYTFDGSQPSYNNTVERINGKSVSLENIEKGVTVWLYINLSD